MVLRMARLKSRKNSSIPPFRERVPADVLELARNQKPTIRLQAAAAGEPGIVLTPKLAMVLYSMARGAVASGTPRKGSPPIWLLGSGIKGSQMGEKASTTPSGTGSSPHVRKLGFKIASPMPYKAT